MPNQNARSQAPVDSPQVTVRPGTHDNEGEGSRSAARNYDKASEQYAKSGRVEKAAKAAEQALEGAEGDELRAAEAEAKKQSPKKDADSEAQRQGMDDPTEGRE